MNQPKAEEQEPVKLSAEQMELLRQGDEDLENGISYSLEEAIERARAHATAWMQANPAQSA